MTFSYTTPMIMAVLPEILLLVLGVLVLAFDLVWKDEKRRNLGWLSAGGLVLIIVVSLFIARPSEPESVFGGMIRFDWMAFFFKMLFLFAAAITSLLMMDLESLNRRGESYLLLLAATMGMSLMASAADVMMLYLAIETTSIPLYILAGFMKEDDFSTEAGFKYLLFGALTSAVMLYGFSLIYGFTGTTNFGDLSTMFSSGELPLSLAAGLIFLIVVGIGFKVSIVPFHFWAPDVYQGAPTAVAGFLSTVSKAAGFAALMRLFLIAFPTVSVSWSMLLAVLATLTMTLGNLVALAQTNIKRLLAYSSIAHAGYAMIGVVVASELGAASVVFYLAAYILTNLAAFGVVTAVGHVTGSDDIKAYAGLSRRAPGLALAMLVAFLSLAGMPPFGGFVAKVFVFAAAVQEGWIWLAFVGVLNSIVGLYYYLTVLKYVYLYRMEGEDEEAHPIPLSRSYAIALTVLSLGILMIGIAFAPWFGFSNAAAINLF